MNEKLDAAKRLERKRCERSAYSGKKVSSSTARVCKRGVNDAHNEAVKAGVKTSDDVYDVQRRKKVCSGFGHNDDNRPRCVQ